jgi:hypothetical protein
MKTMRGVVARRGAALVMGVALVLSAAPAFAKVADRCDTVCGPPTPCCLILGIPWCGCWFDDEETVQSVQPSDSDAAAEWLVPEGAADTDASPEASSRE